VDKETKTMVSANSRRCQLEIYLELKPALNAILGVPAGFSVCIEFFFSKKYM